jgi:hypothetical protein
VISEFCLSSNLQEVSCSSDQLSELSSEILQAGLSRGLVGKGESMRPMVREGDLLEIQPADPSSIHRGEIVLCLLKDGHVVIHRVVRIDRRAAGLRFLIQGDQVLEPDGWIGAYSVLGRLVELERDGKRISMQSEHSRLLGQLAALRLQWKLNRTGLGHWVVLTLKHLPGFLLYLG